MIATIVLSLCLTGQEPKLVASGEQFKKIVDAARSELKDVALIYEGRLDWVGPESLLGSDPKGFGRTFQGNFVYRNDEAELADLYTLGLQETAVVVRTKQSIIKNIFRRSEMITDLDKDEFAKQPGSPSLMSGPDSFHTLFIYPLYDSMKNMGAWGYEFQAWEIIDGRRCARVRLNWSGGASEWHRLLWIDVERNCHPLKEEDFEGGRMFVRVDRIELRRFGLSDGKEMWFPVRGRLEGFKWEEKFYDEPVMRQSFSVVDGSVLINQGVPDALFEFERSAESPIARRLDRQASTLPLRKAFLGLKREPPKRVDMEGIEKQLAEALKEADRQSERLVASSPAREAWSWMGVAQSVAILLGVFAIAVSGGLLILSRARR